MFTITELAQYNGDNGSLAYIAVSWVVYDVTHAPKWTNGWHKGMHLAGKDCTVAFLNQHSMSYLSGLPIVGTLAPY
ncbi:MAG: cytochrome B5 [Firmicutes bacterium]|nr:cytochrome B5 [Bacillota bacterium]